ncbi:MAG: type II/IV secretion system ATPase subunit [Thaumarchaeota archaeon]|nr:type II/IV secretion system ATPase subunit [Nitrososphaerota archaeon]
MRSALLEAFLRIVRTRPPPNEPAPLLVELFGRSERYEARSERTYPFSYRVVNRDSAPFYEVSCSLGPDTVMALRKAVSEASLGLDPGDVDPLTFRRLVEVLTQLSAERLASYGVRNMVKELSELAAYEAIGLSRIMALAKDDKVTEFYVDSESTPLYLDHTAAGRCESAIVLTERERSAIETHVDTFSGYTLDYKTPSMKNDLPIAGAILRVSLDLEPVAVNRFALDVRRLNVSSLSLPQLIGLGVLSVEAASMLVGWLECGGNLTVIGETGTGKTTLLNALDEQVERRLRRLYIEDAVETRDLLGRGFHQMKVKVDPFERGNESGRTKESEIVKALHRSPDIVILSEIQSEEHSRAFFQALSSGARGIQTFHASTIEQAVRRWVNMHHISEQSLLDLGLLVQMARPDRLKQGRYVQRICSMTQDRGTPRIKELFMRDREFKLRNVAGPGLPAPPEGVEVESMGRRVALASQKISGSQGAG